MVSWTKKPAAKGFGKQPETEEEASQATPPQSEQQGEASVEAKASDGEPSPPTAYAGEKEPSLPGGWTDKRRKAPKRWSQGRRTDDPTKRKIYEPLASGIGTGKSFQFIFGFKIHSDRDQSFLTQMLEPIEDDIEVLRNAGYTVAVDQQGTNEDFVSAVTGQGDGVKGLIPAGVFWSAHGLADGSVETCDGGVVRPEDLDPKKVSDGLRLVVFASCYVGNRSRTWRKALGGSAMVVGWGRPVTVDRAIEFLTPEENTETDLDDLLERYLLADTPIPDEKSLSYSPFNDAVSTGRTGDLPDRINRVVDMLNAKTRKEETCVWLDVPLEEKRWHAVRVFVITSNEPFSEGEVLLAAEADIGEITEVVDPPMLLSGVLGNGFARINLVQSKTDMPRIVSQGFLPLARVRDQDLAALVYQVCQAADTVERRIFGGDMA